MIPELLAPAGSIDAVRAAVANGADAVYLGAERFNARDDGAQLTLDELTVACRIAHQRGVRVYLTLNVLVKPAELAECLEHLAACIACGIDAAIVQDVGLIRLIQRVFPGFEVHGSTQMTVHDVSGATFLRDLGVRRVVLARENTLDDIRAIRDAIPELGLESFVHGALCISYSGQCYMSGMISERSANRGSCAQSCRKDYVLRDDASGSELDRGYLISARDLAAHEHLPSIVDAGIVCLKVEGRKKKPEYVATVASTYRSALDRIAAGDGTPLDEAAVEPLVQIFSRGFTGGMYGGRAGRAYVTRTHPDNRGAEIGEVVACERGEVLVDVRTELHRGDGVGFEPPEGGAPGATRGFTVGDVRTISATDGRRRQALRTLERIPVGWRVVRNVDAALVAQAKASFAGVDIPDGRARTRLDVRVFGSAGRPLKALFSAHEIDVTVESDQPLVPASVRALDDPVLREQLGRLGDTAFVLGSVDRSALADGLFLPLSELNRVRRRAVEALEQRLADHRDADRSELHVRIAQAIDGVPHTEPPVRDGDFTLVASVFSVDDARVAAAAGATEVVIDPFLRHPVPPRARVRALAEELRASSVTLRLRTPTIIRPEDRKRLEPWLALGLPVLTGHAGLASQLAAAGADVVADYAVNAFNPHTAAEFFGRGVRRVVASVELTANEIADLATPWQGRGIDVVVYGRPEGMTIEHCVLSAAFDREPTTCRDLCVQHHPRVTLTDPAGYDFPVATDTDCRNRLLHSRPIEGSEFAPSLWRAGIRGFHLLFNVPNDPVEAMVRSVRSLLDDLASGGNGDWSPVRAIVHGAFTRGHFARAV